MVRKALMKWAASATFLAIVVLLCTVVNNESVLIILGLVFFMLALPALILVTMELGRVLREADGVPMALRVLGFVISMPQALFGFLTAAIGVAIILWVAYNYLVERQPQFASGLMIGPALAAVGYWWMRNAFRRKRHDGT